MVSASEFEIVLASAKVGAHLVKVVWGQAGLRNRAVWTGGFSLSFCLPLQFRFLDQGEFRDAPDRRIQ
jgi:hypothetical protein